MAEKDWLREILVSVQLEKFYLKFKEDDISLPSHFDHVTTQYLVKTGLSVPAQKRLLDAVKKARKKEKKYNKKYGPIIHRGTISLQHGSGGLIDENDIEEGRELGDGSFGVVKAGVWRSGSKRTDVAIKTLKLAEDVDMSSLNDFILEISAMNKLNNRYLLQLYGVVLSNPIKIISQLAPGGNLLSKLRRQKIHSILRLTEYAVQIASGMEFLGGEGFTHRDLACRNILIFSESEVKIGDFGMMRRVNENGIYKMEEKRKIPIAWSAPESLRKREFSEKSDVWSFGVVLWEIFTFGKMPWQGSTSKEIISMIENGVRLNIAKYITQTIWDVVLTIWSYDTSKRPSFKFLVQKLIELIPAETKVLRNTFIGNLPFVRRGQFVYVIRAVDEENYLAQCTASLEISELPKSSLEAVQGIEACREGQSKIITKRDNEFISLPIKETLVHSAHGSSSLNESWGSPDTLFRESKTKVTPEKTEQVPLSATALSKKLSNSASSAPNEDLLGGLADELKARPFFVKQNWSSWPDTNNFADMHNKIKLTFESTSSFKTSSLKSSYLEPASDYKVGDVYYQPPTCGSDGIYNGSFYSCSYSYGDVYNYSEVPIEEEKNSRTAIIISQNKDFNSGSSGNSITTLPTHEYYNVPSELKLDSLDAYSENLLETNNGYLQCATPTEPVAHELANDAPLSMNNERCIKYENSSLSAKDSTDRPNRSFPPNNLFPPNDEFPPIGTSEPRDISDWFSTDITKNNQVTENSQNQIEPLQTPSMTIPTKTAHMHPIQLPVSVLQGSGSFLQNSIEATTAVPQAPKGVHTVLPTPLRPTLRQIIPVNRPTIGTNPSSMRPRYPTRSYTLPPQIKSAKSNTVDLSFSKNILDSLETEAFNWFKKPNSKENSTPTSLRNSPDLNYSKTSYLTNELSSMETNESAITETLTKLDTVFNSKNFTPTKSDIKQQNQIYFVPLPSNNAVLSTPVPSAPANTQLDVGIAARQKMEQDTKISTQDLPILDCNVSNERNMTFVRPIDATKTSTQKSNVHLTTTTNHSSNLLKPSKSTNMPPAILSVSPTEINLYTGSYKSSSIIKTDKSSIALMKSSDAVKLLRQKYELNKPICEHEVQAEKTPIPVSAEKRDIFSRNSARSSLIERKQLDMKVKILINQFNSRISKEQAEFVLIDNKFNMKASIRAIKLQKLYLLASREKCEQALTKSNGDPDIALSILTSNFLHN